MDLETAVHVIFKFFWKWEVYAVNIIWSQQLLSGRHAIDFNSQILRKRYTSIMCMTKLLNYICPQNIMLYSTLLSKLAYIAVYPAVNLRNGTDIVAP